MLQQRSRVASTSRVRALVQLSIFADLSPAEVRRLEPLTCGVHRKAGRVLTRQGCVGREAFVVVSGTADVQVDGRTVGRLGPGDVIGEISLLTGEPRNATVSALTDMELLVLDRGQFAELLRDDRIADRVTSAARVRRRVPAP